MKNLLLIPLAGAAILPAMTALPASAAAKKEAPEQRPNVLFIMTDQQRWDAVALAGKFPFLKTPNLDKLAKSGAWFTHCYTQCAVSGPARSTILSGMMVEHHNVRTNDLANEDPVKHNITKVPTFDQVLADNGYYTEYHGKFHSPLMWTSPYVGYQTKPDNKNPFKAKSVEFDEYGRMVKEALGNAKPGKGEVNNKYFGAPYRPDPIDRDVYAREHHEDKARPNVSQADAHGELLMPLSLTLTTFQAKRTIDALARAKKSGKPFSITCSFTMPHAPMLPVRPYYGMYKVEDMPVPPSIADPMTDSPYVNANGRKSLPEYADKDAIKHMISAYLGLVTEVDTWVGEILSALEKNGQSENTLVIFTSDHGEMMGSHGMREKNVFLEESSRIPLMMSYPGVIEPGTVVDRYVSNIDLASTILDYMGVPDSGKRDGRSLRSHIDGKATGDNMVVTEWLYRGPAQPTHQIVKDGWKLFLSYEPKPALPCVLYNLNDDPYEMNNLIGPSNPDRAKYIAKASQLRDDMSAWLKAHGSEYAAPISKIKF